MSRILLGHLGSNGDCLYATTIARQIKTDFPGCHLTWAISSLCKEVIRNNPDVDEVWEVEIADWGELNAAWGMFEAEAWMRVARGDFDNAFMTQICPAYFRNYDGTIRPSIFRNYPHSLTVPAETVIRLSDEEIERADQWLDSRNIKSYENVILFECSSKSGQSFMTPDLALDVAKRVIRSKPDTCIILSTHVPIDTNNRNIIHGGELSLRETVRLTHHADLFVGCGSGVTVVATSGAAKQELPNIQLLNKNTSVYASFKHDFEYFGKRSSHFLETTRKSPAAIARIVLAALNDGIEEARHRHEQVLSVTFDWYLELIELMLIKRRRYIDAGHSLTVTAERYGWKPELRAFGTIYIEPFLDLDPSAIFGHRRDEIESFRARLSESV